MTTGELQSALALALTRRSGAQCWTVLCQALGMNLCQVPRLIRSQSLRMIQLRAVTPAEVARGIADVAHSHSCLTEWLAPLQDTGRLRRGSDQLPGVLQAYLL